MQHGSIYNREVKSNVNTDKRTQIQVQVCPEPFDACGAYTYVTAPNTYVSGFASRNTCPNHLWMSNVRIFHGETRIEKNSASLIFFTDSLKSR